MPFGATATTQNTTAQSTTRRNEVFMNTQQGMRLFRLLGDEVQIQRFWLEKDESGKFVPSFGFVRGSKKVRVPVITSILRANGRWTTEDGPIRAWIAAQDISDEARDKMYPQRRFMMNVLDRTPQIVTDEGIIYPNAVGKFYVGNKEVNSVGKVVPNEVRIFEAPSGKITETNGVITGNHVYARLLRAVTGHVTYNSEGKEVPADFSRTDMRLVITGGDGAGAMDFNFTPTANTEDLGDRFEIFDFNPWPVLYPAAMQQDLLDGRDYNECVAAYNIPLYPNKTLFSL